MTTIENNKIMRSAFGKLGGAVAYQKFGNELNKSSATNRSNGLSVKRESIYEIEGKQFFTYILCPATFLYATAISPPTTSKAPHHQTKYGPGMNQG